MVINVYIYNKNDGSTVYDQILAIVDLIVMTKELDHLNSFDSW